MIDQALKRSLETTRTNIPKTKKQEYLNKNGVNKYRKHNKRIHLKVHFYFAD